MFSCCHHRLLTFATTLAGVLVAANSADAAWVTFKNDSGKTIVVQEITIVNGQVKRGKPTNLLPGETIREFVPGPTIKKVEVFDAQNPNQTVWSGTLNCKDDTQTFSVAAAGGKFNVTPVASPPPPPNPNKK
jgi:hypothetical protein